MQVTVHLGQAADSYHQLYIRTYVSDNPDTASDSEYQRHAVQLISALKFACMVLVLNQGHADA